MKRLIVTLCALGASSGCFLVSAKADASPVRCACPATQASGPAFGNVTAASGKVTITGPKGVKTASIGSVLPAGASLFTAAHSGASVAFGSGCGVQLGENSTLVVEQMEGKLCPKITELSVTSSPSASYGAPAGTGTSGDVPTPVIGAFVALSATMLTISIADDKDGNGGAISP